MAKQDTEAVRQAASGRWPGILQSVAGIPPERLDPSQEHPCPKCGGETRFRLVDEVAGAVRCSHCFSTKCGDGFAAVAWMLGLSFPAAVARVAEHLGIAAIGEKDPAKDLEWEEWSPLLAAHFLQAKPGVTEEGLLLAGARMARYKKQFTVIALPVIGQDMKSVVGWAICNYNAAPLPKYNREGVQIGQVKVKITYGSKPGLVGRHAIERIATPGLPELIWKVEGITDLLALQSLIPEQLRDRHLVVTNANGAKETPRWQATALAPTSTNIVHDADQPGMDGAKAWATQIASQSPAGVKVRHVQLPYEVAKNHGKDLRDWIAEGRTYADLLTLADQTTPLEVARTASGEVDFTKVEYPIQKRILEKLQLEVLYEEETGAIRVFSTFNKKSSTIRQIDRLKRETLIQICGSPAKEYVVLAAQDSDGESAFSVSDVREAIALVASSRRGRGDERGIGIWQGRDDWGNETNTIVLVNKGDGVRWNGDQVLRQIIAPRADGLVLDFGAGGADIDDWFDFKSLERYMAESASVDWRRAVVDETVQLFDRWNWSHQDVDPTIMAGAVLATWVQTIWKWRPLIAVAGKTGSGKSLLFQALGGADDAPGLFGALAFKQAKSSAAGIIQGLANTARIPLIDEFEAGRERSKTLEHFRLAGRGEKQAKGTSHHKAVSQSLRHMCWVAAIEVGLEKQPDQNRFIQFELRGANAGQEGKLVVPEGRYLLDLGQKLLAIAVRSGVAAKKLAVDLKSTQVAGIDSRIIECYAVPAAMLAVAEGVDHAAATAILHRLLANVDKAEQGRIDHEDLIGDIMAANVNLGGRGVLTVGQILESPSYRADYSARLEAAGVKVIPDEYGNDQSLFIVPKAVSQHLLRGGAWEGQNLAQIVMRTPGAARTRLRVGGANQRGVAIPIKVISLTRSEF